MDFLYVFREFITYHSTTSVFYDKRKQKTIDAYGVRYRLVSEFLLSGKSVKLQAKNFTIKLAKEYFAILSKKHSHNYATRNVEVCRAVLDFAASREWIRYNPLGSLSMRKTAPGKPLYLTLDEIAKLEAYEPKLSMIKKARLMFLFQIYTGMDYGDISSVNVKDVINYKDREFIVKKRLKTNIEAFIPYSDKAKEIFEGCNGKLSLMTNCKYNQALKVIARDLSIKTNITSHIGRKTFASTKLNIEGYSMEAVSKMLGHKSIKTTEVYYTQIEIELISRELDKLDVMQNFRAIA